MTRDIKTQKARVTAVYRGRWLVLLDGSEKGADVTGKFRHEAKSPVDFPVVGDWVEMETVDADFALIHSVLPRTSLVARKAAGASVDVQALAANVDAVFIVTAFDADFNLRRLERYLALARQADAEPVIILNKSDLASADDPRLAQAETVIGWGRVLRLSAKTGEGVEAAANALRGGKTGVLVGSSGVGKSTLTNALLGQGVQPTQTIRLSDGKGRHTTTTRQMFPLPNGGFLIDTPGLREIQLWADEEDLESAFQDIAALAKECRFKDCAHEEEPGCAVRAAREDGRLDPARWNGFVKLKKEAAYLKRKQDPEQRANTKKRWKKIHQLMRKKKP